MKDKEYVLNLLDNALNDYSDAVDSIDKLVAVVQINLLQDLVELREIPLRMQLRMQHITFELMLKEYEEKFQVAFPECF